MKQIITQKNFVEKLKRRNEKALEYVIREYGGYVKAAVNHNLAGLPEEMEECMEEDVSNYESELAKNDRIDTLEQEISMETEKLLEGLKEEERQILLRYYAEEEDVDVLAEEYGVSDSAIYSKVSRAKKKVRKNHRRLEERI